MVLYVSFSAAVAMLPSFLPGMGFKRKADRYKKQYYALADRGHRWVENEIVRRSSTFTVPVPERED